MGVVLKGGKYYLDYRYQGRRIRECIGTNKRMADDAWAVRKAEIVQGRYQMKQRISIRFDEFSEIYMDHSRANKRSWDRDKTLLSNLIPAFGKVQMRDVNALLIERYRQQRLAKVKPATVNRETGLLKHMYNMAILWGKATDNPMKGVKKLREETIPERILLPEEITKLLAACSEHYSRPIVLTALTTGMRLNEILSLKWAQVDLEQRFLTVLSTASKNGKVRKIPISDALLETLQALKVKAISEYVFIYYKTKGPISVFRGAWFNAQKRAGLPHFRFHDLRHTFASSLVRSGVDLKTVMELLGHSTIMMTSRYAHSAPETKKKAVAVMDNLVKEESGHYVDTRAKTVKTGQKCISGKAIHNIALQV